MRLLLLIKPRYAAASPPLALAPELGSVHAPPILAAASSCVCVCLLSQVWANYQEKPAEEFVHVSEEKERVAKYRAVYVTEITDMLHFYTQDVETGKSAVPLKRHADFMSVNYLHRSDIRLIPGRRRPPRPPASACRPNKGRPVCYGPRNEGDKSRRRRPSALMGEEMREKFGDGGGEEVTTPGILARLLRHRAPPPHRSPAS